MDHLRVCVLLVMALLQSCVVWADYDCLCNYKVETNVYAAPNDQGTPLGSLYEFDCKAIHGPLINGYSEIEYEHQVAYVKVEDDVSSQMCPGDIPETDKVTTAASSPKPQTTTPQMTTTTTVAKTVTPTPKPTTPSTTPQPTTERPTTSAPTTSTTKSTTTTTTTTLTPVTTSTPQPVTSTATRTTPTTTTAPTTSTTTTTTRPITTTATVAPQAKCPRSGMTTTFGGSCYEIVHHHRDFNDAEADCRHAGGHLMHIQSAAEQDFITKFLHVHYNHEVWIGLGDHHHEERWTWTSGVALRYTHWDPHRKDFFFHGLEDCVVLQPSDNGYWDDRRCDGFLASEHSYVCQYTGRVPGSVLIG